MAPVKRILLALDLLSPPEQWAPWVKSLARGHDAAVLVLAVAPDMTALSNFYPPHARFQEKVVCRTESQLKALVDEHLRDMPEVETLVLIGREAGLILEAARQKQVDLIILGVRRRRGLDRLLYGCSVQEVVKKAPCPVLIMGPG